MPRYRRNCDETPEDKEARAILEKRRWPNGPRCVFCGSANVTRLTQPKGRAGVFNCNSCRGKEGQNKASSSVQFTVTTLTGMHDTHLPLSIWLRLADIQQTPTSILQASKELGVTYKTAHRIWHIALGEELLA